MSSSQNHVADKNRQPLHNGSGRRDTDALPPHLRPHFMKTSISSPEPEVQTPKETSKGQLGHAPPHQEVFAAHPSGSMRSDKTNFKVPLPKYFKDKSNLESADPKLGQRQDPADFQEIRPSRLVQRSDIVRTSPDPCHNGLAKSRWADQDIPDSSAPVAKPSMSPDSSLPLVQNQQPAAAKNQVENRIIAAELGPRASTQQSSELRPQSLKGRNGLQQNSYNESTGMDTQTKKLEPLSESLLLAAATLAKVAEEDPTNPTTEVKNIASSSPVDPVNIVKPMPDEPIPVLREDRASELNAGQKVRQDMENRTGQQKKPVDAMPTSTEWKKLFPKYYSLPHYVFTWMQDAHDVTTHFLTERTDRYMNCDIDTYTGIPLNPVDYPDTRLEGMRSDAQRFMTAETKRKEFIESMVEQVFMDRRMDQGVRPHDEAGREPSRTAGTTSSEWVLGAPARAQAQAQAQMREKMAAANVPETVVQDEVPTRYNGVKIPCHLRPVRKSDIAAVQAIYNQEIREGYKVVNTEPVNIAAFQAIYSQCQAKGMPFVVAIKGQAKGAGPHQEVIGFALITALERGIDGSYETLSSHGGKLLVIVKPEYRRKKIGTALMDAAMRCFSGHYSWKDGYEFVHPTDYNESLLYEGDGPKKLWYIDAHVMILSDTNEAKTREGEEFRWIWNFLELKFVLLLSSYDEKCCYDPRHNIWLDKLTFRHRCQ
ncbi:hypothetical protein F4861DRAFT_498179 [Xylaria intraflava]|nr:hypothetical protein F4861DRAFT_498179 [Xylaria intraflava]